LLSFNENKLKYCVDGILGSLISVSQKVFENLRRFIPLIVEPGFNLVLVFSAFRTCQNWQTLFSLEHSLSYLFLDWVHNGTIRRVFFRVVMVRLNFHLGVDLFTVSVVSDCHLSSSTILKRKNVWKFLWMNVMTLFLPVTVFPAMYLITTWDIQVWEGDPYPKRHKLCLLISDWTSMSHFVFILLSAL